MLALSYSNSRTHLLFTSFLLLNLASLSLLIITVVTVPLDSIDGTGSSSIMINSIIWYHWYH